MRHIRPWELFAHLGYDREVVFRIPRHKGTESETVMSLETLLLVAAARIVDARTILEFGTCLGYNAMHLTLNTLATVHTVDRERRAHVQEQGIIFDVADIFTFGPREADMVFCDINYTPETVARCTELAFAADAKVIAWHDYGHPQLPHVAPYLDSIGKDLIHVEDSWMVFWFREGLL